MFFGATARLTGGDPGGGKPFSRVFFILEFRDVFVLGVLAAVWDGGVPLTKRRFPGGILGWVFFSLLPETTFLAGVLGCRAAGGGFWAGFADVRGTLARCTFARLESVASPAVGDSDEKTDTIFEIMSLRWLNSMTAATATNSSIRNRYRILRRRLRLFKLSTGLDAIGPGSAGWG